MLTADSISCIRNDNVIFRQFGFTFGQGAIFVVQGANGSGKTSLLTMLAGLSTPSEGEIYWYDEKIDQDYFRQLQFLGHQNALKPALTVYENLHFWSKLHGSDEMVAAAIHYFGLEDYATIPCYALSQGWKRRVALARVMACESDLWILDEPFSHLDEEGIYMLSGLISVKCDQGGTVILSHHGIAPLEGSISLSMDDFK